MPRVTRYRVTARRLDAFRTALPMWFRQNRRKLPWRTNRTPYRVWVSELMLQQTRADQATPYYHRFMKRFPSVTALARARRSDVMKMWEGLGYYSRAMRAHETARHVVDHHGGRFPDQYDQLLVLPGVGPYTAAAVASLAFNRDHAVLDGNVIRVMARAFGVDEVTDRPAVKRILQNLLDRLLPPGHAAEFNESMMELGALVCTPRTPRCDVCPLSAVCVALKQGKPTAYPVRVRKKRLPHRDVGAGVIVDSRGRILIAQRMEKSMLGGLWEFPGGGVEEGESLPQCIARELEEELGITTRVGPHLVTVRHTFSHFRMDLHAYWVRIASGRPKAIHCADYRWVRRDEIGDYALPVADRKILAALLAAGAAPRF